MSETQTSEPTRTDGSAAKLAGAPSPYLRHGLTLGGIALVATNFTLRMTGSDSVVAPTVLWASATLCFLGSFIVYMMEPQGTAEPQPRREEATRDPPAADTAPNGDPKKPSTEDKDDSRGAASLLRRGNPLRLTRGGITILASSIPALILMGHERQTRWGVPSGALLVAIAAWGVMDLLGTFDDAESRISKSTSINQLSRPRLAFGAALLFFSATLPLAPALRRLS